MESDKVYLKRNMKKRFEKGKYMYVIRHKGKMVNRIESGRIRVFRSKS